MLPDDNLVELVDAYSTNALMRDFAAEFRHAIETHSTEDAIRLAATKGIELTADDFAPDAAALDGRELDESELEAVAGGNVFDDFMKGVGCVILFLVATN